MKFNIKRQLKRTSIATNTMLVALCFVAVSCTKVELDEKERALVAKQELANNFDKLFEEAFEKPDETEQKLRTFVIQIIYARRNVMLSAFISLHKQRKTFVLSVYIQI